MTEEAKRFHMASGRGVYGFYRQALRSSELLLPRMWDLISEKQSVSDYRDGAGAHITSVCSNNTLTHTHVTLFYTIAAVT